MTAADQSPSAQSPRTEEASTGEAPIGEAGAGSAPAGDGHRGGAVAGAAPDQPGAAATAEGPAVSDPGAFDLAAQIRQLAGCDPADVQRVISDVLAALERVTGGRVRERLAEPDTEAGRISDPG